jgi:predicted protein tyrosine phosphatase
VGTSPDADTIFVMERVHRTWVQQRFRRHLRGKRVICLDISGDDACMDPALMALLTKRMARFV